MQVLFCTSVVTVTNNADLLSVVDVKDHYEATPSANLFLDKMLLMGCNVNYNVQEGKDDCSVEVKFACFVWFVNQIEAEKIIAVWRFSPSNAFAIERSNKRSLMGIFKPSLAATDESRRSFSRGRNSQPISKCLLSRTQAET
ncbi:hypothetical protein LINGRAHAP2_LOCUS2577 [Linum grandiflorum]